MPLLQKMLVEDPKKMPDFKDLLLMINELKIEEIAPNDEYQFYDIWKTEKENEKEKTYENLQNLYIEHRDLYLSYEMKLGKTKIAKYHISRAFQLLEELKGVKIEANDETKKEKDTFKRREEILSLTRM